VTNEEKFENIKVEIRSRKLKDRHHNWKKKISLIQNGQTMHKKPTRKTKDQATRIY
jgi:hypothetical protein